MPICRSVFMPLGARLMPAPTSLMAGALSNSVTVPLGKHLRRWQARAGPAMPAPMIATFIENSCWYRECCLTVGFPPVYRAVGVLVKTLRATDHLLQYQPLWLLIALVVRKSLAGGVAGGWGYENKRDQAGENR